MRKKLKKLALVSSTNKQSPFIAAWRHQLKMGSCYPSPPLMALWVWTVSLLWISQAWCIRVAQNFFFLIFAVATL